MRSGFLRATLLIMLMFSATFAGCFGENESRTPLASDLIVKEVDSLQGGAWQSITLTAESDLSVFIPYFIQDMGSLRAQNGTVFDLQAGQSQTVNVLFPPRNPNIVLLIGDYARSDWPIRAADES